MHEKLTISIHLVEVKVRNVPWRFNQFVGCSVEVRNVPWRFNGGGVKRKTFRGGSIDLFGKVP